MRVLEVRRDDLGQTRVVQGAAEPGPGDAVLKPDLFSLTANNVTYAHFGATMRYWDFFPASDDGWGRVPVWGYATVTASRADGLAEGTRLYGYLPMGDTLLVQPGKAGPRGFADVSAHRAGLAAAYNQYQAVAPGDPDTEARIAILKPLHTTGFLLDDYLASAKGQGARRILASSASSKTALAMADSLARRGGMEVVGLTSARSVPFVESTGLYAQVVAYEDIAALAPAGPAAYVDFAGAGAVTAAVHRALGDSLVLSLAVGGAHAGASRQVEGGLTGPRPEFFFAPSHAGWLAGEMGARAFADQADAALTRFVAGSTRWMQVHEAHGLDGAAEVWRDLIANRISPDTGAVARLDP